MAEPRVSVVVPVVDPGPDPGEAIDSVLGQTFRDFEVLVIDAGPTDVARGRLARFTRPRTRVLIAEPRGAAAALNRALPEARGAYLSVLEPAARLEPLFLERAAGMLDADRSVAFASC